MGQPSAARSEEVTSTLDSSHATPQWGPRSGLVGGHEVVEEVEMVKVEEVEEMVEVEEVEEEEVEEMVEVEEVEEVEEEEEEEGKEEMVKMVEEMVEVEVEEEEGKEEMVKMVEEMVEVEEVEEEEVEEEEGYEEGEEEEEVEVVEVLKQLHGAVRELSEKMRQDERRVHTESSTFHRWSFLAKAVVVLLLAAGLSVTSRESTSPLEVTHGGQVDVVQTSAAPPATPGPGLASG
ncbi:unnamed protein product, partial [Lampetra fluviatilis]